MCPEERILATYYGHADSYTTAAILSYNVNLVSQYLLPTFKTYHMPDTPQVLMQPDTNLVLFLFIL